LDKTARQSGHSDDLLSDTEMKKMQKIDSSRPDGVA
jgi:hypothetical protein